MPTRPTAAPYGASRIYPRGYAATIAELTARQGEIVAEGAARSGAIWGPTVAGLGQTAGQYLQQRQEQKTQEKRRAAFEEALGSFNSDDPMGTYRKLAVAVGPEPAVEILKGVIGIRNLQTKADKPNFDDLKATVAGLAATKTVQGDEYLKQHWPTIRGAIAPAVKTALGIDLPEEWSDEVPKGIDALNQAWNAPKEGAGFELSPGQTRFDPSGKPIAALPAKPEKPEPTLAEIEAEALARARGTARGKPPDATPGKWTEGVGPGGEPILYNAETGETKRFPEGVKPKPSGRQSLTKDERAQFASINFVLPKLDQFADFVQKNPSFYGRFDALKTAIQQQIPGFASGDYASKEAFIGRLNSEIRHALFGAALTGGEQESAKSFLIEKSDQPVVILSKIRAAKERMESDIGYYRGLGYMVSSGKAIDEDALLKKYGY